jgi:signal transduction histidine kinase
MEDIRPKDHSSWTSTAAGVVATLTAAGSLVLLVSWTTRLEATSRAPRLGAVLGLATSFAAAIAFWSLLRLQHRLRGEIVQANTLALRALEMLGASPQVATSSDAAGAQLIDRMSMILGRLAPLLEEHRQREREVLRADQLALVGQMAAGVAHEIRNPLTSIKMLVQSGQKDGMAADLSSDDLRIIEQEIRRMERSLQRFLDFARPPHPEQRPLNLVPLLEQTAALVEGRAKKQRIAMQIQAPDEVVLVNADRDQLQQLVLNLVINALDVMPDGGRLLLRLSQPNDAQVELRVEDTGPGIPAHLLPRLFDPFVSTKETGVGLGLAVSFRIAERHAGRLWAETDRPQGAGACLVLSLPVLETQSNSAARR